MKMALIFIIAAATTSVLILCLRPLLVRYALARPNVRSSHKRPTPQGGGIAVFAGTVLAVAGGLLFAPTSANDLPEIAILFASAALLAMVGIVDDIRPINPLPRLLLQALVVLIAVAALPSGLRLLPIFPWWIEKALLFVSIVWFVNLVNFMDGIDWITVAEVVPVTAALALFGTEGALPHEATLVAFALCGAMIGFAPFNRPVARLFLGDVGSLPIGLLLCWLLVLLADKHFIAALLLPLYYVGDATITLIRRMLRGERLMQAHRSHFYQHALDNGLTVYKIVGRIFMANLVLIGLAALTLMNLPFGMQMIFLLMGIGVVILLLWSFEYTKPSDIAL